MKREIFISKVNRFWCGIPEGSRVKFRESGHIATLIFRDKKWGALMDHSDNFIAGPAKAHREYLLKRFEVIK